MIKLKTKGLDGGKYELKYYTDYDGKQKYKNHQPDRIIIPFNSFGYGTRIPVREAKLRLNDITYDENINKGAEVVAFYNRNGKFIIEAVENTKKEKKKKYVKNIMKEIDLTQGLANETFISILTNVFTKERLKEIRNAKNIEMLSFEGLMYLKVKNKAYRL